MNNYMPAILYVCEDCYKKDQKVLKCYKKFNDHLHTILNNKCDVCGKEKPVIVWCINYTNIQMETKQRCMFAKIAMTKMQKP